MALPLAQVAMLVVSIALGMYSKTVSPIGRSVPYFKCTERRYCGCDAGSLLRNGNRGNHSCALQRQGFIALRFYQPDCWNILMPFLQSRTNFRLN